LFGKMMPGWYVLEADAELISGTFAGAGVFIYSQMTAESDTSYVIDFDLEPDINGTVAGAGSTGKIYRWRKLVQLTHATPSAGFPYIYAVAHWTGTGDVSVANSIKFHRAAVRAASQAEIEARQAKNDLVTTNANVASNTSAIATETSARAAADTTLTASVKNSATAFGASDFTADGLYWTNGFGGSPSSLSDPSGGIAYADVTNIGRVMRVTTFPTYLSQKAVIRPTLGRRYRLTIECRAQADASGGTLSVSLGNINGLDTSYNHGAGSATGYAAGSLADSANLTVAGGWVTIGKEFSLTSASTYDAAWRLRLDLNRSAGSGGAIDIRKFLIEEVTDVTTLTASVTTNASAIATVNGAAAFWETIVSAGGGDLSAVRLKAGSTGSYIELISTVLRLANVSNGAVIEVMRAISGEAFFSRPISSDSASRRLTIGPGYGVSGSEVVLWFGPVATAPTSQSRTNGYFALGTDGKIYFGSTDLAVLTTPMTATMTGDYSNTHSVNTTPTIDVTATVSAITNGTSPYTYQWALVGMISGTAPELSNVTTASCGIYRGATLGAAADYQGTVSCTITDTNGKQLIKYFNFADFSTI
jgi:hypothetical protein